MATIVAPELLIEATEHQPRARATLAAALASGPSHAYIFRGPPGAGKAAAARAFAAELLADGAPDPDDARRRTMLDPSPHPDLVWLRPPGAQHLVEDVRESVIRAASLRPAEGEHRVFVIEDAEDLRDESQNALLKTLEEPAAFAHLILLCAEPEQLADTILSRCATVEFAALPPEAVLEGLGESGPGGRGRGAAERGRHGSGAPAAERARPGDPRRGLSRPRGRHVASRMHPSPGARCWSRPRRPAPRRLRSRSPACWRKPAAAKGGRKTKLNREATEQLKRTERRARTRALDLGLALCGAWYRDLAAVASGAPKLALNADRASELAADAEGLAPAKAREALELTLDTRRRLLVNVSEELALEALWLRLADALHS